jgi:prepilin-type N-terminal cleavage/methylation domain-containing protein
MFKKGFTLLEVLIVVIILGILASIALPQYVATIEKSKSAEAATNIGSLRTAVDRYWYQSSGSDPANTDISKLDIDNPNSAVNRLYNYAITANTSDASTRAYTIKATRLKAGAEDPNTWVQWTQTDNTTGKLTRSLNLGGPTS